ncbi:hypothetical protein D1872_337550 [compost metagenome]
MENGFFWPESRIMRKFCCLFAGISHPAVLPRIHLIGLVTDQLAGMNEKTVACGQFVSMKLGPEGSGSFFYIMKQEVVV